MATGCFISTLQGPGRSDTRIPIIVAPVFPVPATALADFGQAVDRFDTHDELRVLVPELALHPQPQRGAVSHRQVTSVHAVGEDGLPMKRVDQVDALVIGRAPEIVGAMKDDEARLGPQLRPLEQRAKRHAGPLADRTPALNAVVPRDLRT